MLPLVLQADGSIRTAKEFGTKKELETYLKSHPGADKSLHSVAPKEKGEKKKEDEGKGKGKADAREKKIEEAAKSLPEDIRDDVHRGVVKELADASPEARRMISDGKAREEAMTESAKHLREERDAGITTAVADAGKKADLNTAGRAVAKARRKKKLTPKEVEEVGKGAAAVTESAVNMAVSKRGTKTAYAKAVAYRLYQSFFTLIIQEFSKADGFQGLSDVTINDPHFKKAFNIYTPEEIQARYDKWDAVAEQHDLESEDIDRIQEAQRALGSKLKGATPEEAWKMIRDHVEGEYGHDKALMKRFNNINSSDYHEINRVLEGEEPSKKHRPSKSIREEAEAAAEKERGDKEQQQKKQQMDDANDRLKKTTKQRDVYQRRFKLQQEDLDWVSEYAEKQNASAPSGKGKGKKPPKTDAQKMQEFLAMARPETRERMKGLSPAEFMQILGAVVDADEAGANVDALSKTAAVRPDIAFTAEIYDRVADLFDKGVTDDEMKKMLTGKKPKAKKASLRNAMIRLAYEKPHLRKHLLPLVTR